MDEQSLSHTKWKCQYHIVIIPKYRRKVIYGKLRSDIGKILRRLCEYKHVEIIEAHAMPDHIHIQEQEREDQIMDRLSFKEYEDPFKDLEDM